ncbi:hypothetical protein [Streptomyces sp. Je 1-332]|uniref:hypothetical protein n=1 Tax=Streptomyces sp. Je 1-332 TaxID=3231270 RepID=UPI003459FAB6
MTDEQRTPPPIDRWDTPRQGATLPPRHGSRTTDDLRPDCRALTAGQPGGHHPAASAAGPLPP